MAWPSAVDAAGRFWLELVALAARAAAAAAAFPVSPAIGMGREDGGSSGLGGVSGSGAGSAARAHNLKLRPVYERPPGVFGVLFGVCKFFVPFLIFFLFSGSLSSIGGAVLNLWGERKH